MEQITGYPSLVDAAYKIVQRTPDDQGQIDIASIAKGLGLPLDSMVSISSITDAMEDLVNLGYCKGYEKFDGGCYRYISRSPDAPTIQPSEHPVSIDEQLPFLRSALGFIHGKTVCREFGITYYNHNIRIAVKDALHELLPTSSHNEAAVVELSAGIQYLVNSGLVAGVPFPHNYSLRPAGLLSNEIELYVDKREIFPPAMYFRDPHFLAKVTTIGNLILWVTLSGAICLNRMFS